MISWDSCHDIPNHQKAMHRQAPPHFRTLITDIHSEVMTVALEIRDEPLKARGFATIHDSDREGHTCSSMARPGDDYAGCATDPAG
jgi:hypothetical protein